MKALTTSRLWTNTKHVFASMLCLALTQAAYAQGFDPTGAPPTSDSKFQAIWKNITFGFILFQTIMAIISFGFIYLGAMKLKKHEYKEMWGYWGAALAIFLAPAIYAWFQQRA